MPFTSPFLFEPPPSVTLTQWIIVLVVGFVALAALVRWFIVPPLRTMLHDRQDAIAQAAEQVQTTLADTEKMRNDYRERLEHIEDETAKRMALAVQEADELQKRILAEAQEEAGAIVARGKTEVARERAKVRLRLHREFVDDIVAAAEYSLERLPDPSLEKRLVHGFIADLEKTR